MTNPVPTTQPANGEAFAQAAQRRRPGIFREFCVYLLTNKKWWLTPIMLALLLIAALVLLGGTAAAPFIYTLF